MRPRPATSRLQALVLVLAGALVGLTLVELGMRAAGAYLSRRGAALRGRDAPGVVVLCVGESTTAPTLPKDHSWPAQLAGLLNAAGAGRFTVINEGLTGARSDELLAALPGLLDEHRPDVVVGMLGVNDAQWYGLPDAEAPSIAPRALRSLRLYKLARYVVEEVFRRERPRSGEAGASNQRAIARAVVARGVPLVLMQYPGLEVSELAERFSSFEGGVVLVDNKSAFDRALAGGKYEDYFTDRFAGDWGHCTAAGDRLIAENAAKAVLALGPGRAPPPDPAPTYVARGRARTDFRAAAPAVFSRERSRQLSDFREAPTLDNLGRLLALLREKPGTELASADRLLAFAALEREAGERASAAALSRAADLYLALGEPEKALISLGRLSEARPRDPDAALRRAELAVRMKKTETALAALERARALSPDAPRLRRIALAYQGLGRYRDAAAILEPLARADGRSAQLQQDLGVCLWLAGERERAARAFERALALDPGFAPARESLQALEKQRR